MNRTFSFSFRQIISAAIFFIAGSVLVYIVPFLSAGHEKAGQYSLILYMLSVICLLPEQEEMPISAVLAFFVGPIVACYLDVYDPFISLENKSHFLDFISEKWNHILFYAPSHWLIWFFVFMFAGVISHKGWTGKALSKESQVSAN